MTVEWAPIIAVGLGFVATLSTGFALHQAGRPYGTFVLTVHKLLSVGLLGFVIWSGVAENGLHSLSLAAWVAASISGLSLVVLIGTGGALCIVASPPRFARWLHKIVPYAAIPITALWLALR